MAFHSQLDIHGIPLKETLLFVVIVQARNDGSIEMRRINALPGAQKKLGPSFRALVTAYEMDMLLSGIPLPCTFSYGKRFIADSLSTGRRLSLFVLCSHRASGMTARLKCEESAPLAKRTKKLNLPSGNEQYKTFSPTDKL
jgi:hypothetical protein